MQKHIITDESYSGETRELWLTSVTDLNPDLAYKIFKWYDISDFKNYYFYYIGSPLIYMGNGVYATTKGENPDWKPISYDENIFTKFKNYNWDYTIWQIENGQIESTEFFNEYLVWLDTEKAKYVQIAKENLEKEELERLAEKAREENVLKEYHQINYRRRKRSFVVKAQKENVEVEGWVIEIDSKSVMGINLWGKQYRVTHLATGYFLKDVDTLKLATTLAVWFGDFLFHVDTLDDVPDGLGDKLKDWDNIIRY